MNEFDVVLTLEAQDDIRTLNISIQDRIFDKLAWMGANAQIMRHQSLQGKAWQGTFKYRIGDYRVIYELDKTARQLVVLKVGHRRDVYKL